jgi:L-histidine Nalpha-methyltransferase
MRTASARVPVKRQDPEVSGARFAADVRHYLSQKPRQLPSRYLYDALGSALFDAICRLPWYRVTRAETALLARYGAAILSSVEGVTDLVELGSGNGAKLATLIAAGRVPMRGLDVHLIDVSREALETASRALGIFDQVRVVAYQATYEDGLDDVGRAIGKNGRTLALFLGSNIGNFDPPGAETILRRVRATLRPGDAFLLGADLVKPERDLQLAYDDPLGVTAAFNRNLLVRINRELGADFDVASYGHRAEWNADVSRVEMHLVSLRPQRVRIPAADLELTMTEGETIWTESSYKYRTDELRALLERCGFTDRTRWVDEAAGFALILAEATAGRPEGSGQK